MNDNTVNTFLAIVIIIAAIVLPCVKIVVDSKKDMRNFQKRLDDDVEDFRGQQFLKSISADMKERRRLGLCTTPRISEDMQKRVYNQIGSDLTKVFGDDYKERFDLSKNYGNVRFKPQDCLYWAERLIYAKQGLIIDNGIVRVGEDDVLEWNLKMLKEIETHLSRAHPDAGNDVLYFHAARLIDVKDPVTGKKRKQINKICANELFMLGAHNVKTGRRVWENEDIGDPH